MRIMLTGEHGYIGSVTRQVLDRAGHEVVGLDTLYYRDCDFGPDEGPVVQWIRDVRDVTARDLAGFDAVVHLAALSNDPLGDLRSEWTYAINLDGTIAIARAAKDAGVGRFVFASSCSMYGASGSDDLLDESAPLRPLTPYAESKARSEEALHELADSGFAPTYMRNATAYGVSPRLRLDVVLNNLTAWAHTTGKIRLLSDGSAWRPLVHVEDIARATAALLDAEPATVHDEAFNIGSEDQNLRIRELAEVLNELLGCEIEFSVEATADPRSYRVDFTKLHETCPGFTCTWDVRSGAAELARAYEEYGLTRDEFLESGRYTRLTQLKRLLDEGVLDEDLRWRAALA